MVFFTPEQVNELSPSSKRHVYKRDFYSATGLVGINTQSVSVKDIHELTDALVTRVAEQLVVDKFQFGVYRDVFNTVPGPRKAGHIEPTKESLLERWSVYDTIAFGVQAKAFKALIPSLSCTAMRSWFPYLRGYDRIIVPRIIRN